jgi:hypothetical protein
VNTCNNTVGVWVACNYPDSVSVLSYLKDATYGQDYVAPYSHLQLSYGVGKKLSWHYYFDVSETECEGFVSFYIYDPQTIALNSIEIIEDNYLILARYDIRREDIENLDWKISYPPTEEMQGIHMWLAPETIKLL